MAATPEKKAQTHGNPQRTTHPFPPTLSFYLRDSAAMPPCTFGTRHRASPEPHPFIVPTRTRAPESFTPSAGFRRSPTNFVCRYSLLTLPYHGDIYLSIALFDKLSSCQRRIISVCGQSIVPYPQKTAACFGRRPSGEISKTHGYNPAHPAAAPGRGPASPFSAKPAPCSTARPRQCRNAAAR